MPNHATPRGPGVACGVIAAILLAGPALAQPEAPQPDAYLAELRTEAAALAQLIQTDAVRQWAAATDRLTPITPRSTFVRRQPTPAVLSADAFDALPEGDREGFAEQAIDESSYYATRYGTPLCYARALDLAAEAAGWPSFDGLRVLDYGYGQIGQLRLLAACGAEAVGVDPAPTLAARYALPEDQGPYPPTGEPRGSVTLVAGLWPGEPETADAVGTSFDLIIARNVLKHGYVHPLTDTPAWSRIDLSVEPEAYLASVHDTLVPGGLLLIYNLGGPRLNDGQYNPAADINCPWTRDQLEAAGLEVIAFDRDDSPAFRQHIPVFGWEADPAALESNWFVLYTLVRRPPE